MIVKSCADILSPEKKEKKRYCIFSPLLPTRMTRNRNGRARQERNPGGFVLPNEMIGLGGKRRHIGSLTKSELLRLGWNGETTNFSHSQRCWVPYIHGYDSDSDYEYEPIHAPAPAPAPAPPAPPPPAAANSEEPVTVRIPTVFTR